ncbi:MAG TPA: glycosyltransferase family 4 protein [Acidimicrobiia bacterium]|jgi:glycosyltransferase involved in cell wall biosynthesis
MSRRRLVHVTTTDMSLELLLGPQLSAFRDAGYEVIGASAPGRYLEALEARGVRHYPLRGATRAMAPRRDARALLELRSLFRDLRPDIVHTHNPKPGVYGRLAARAAGVPCVVNTIHGLYALPEDPLSKRALLYSLERIAAACSDAELVQNPEDIPTLRRLGISNEKISFLGNGIDLEAFDPERLGRRRAELRAQLGVTDDDVVCGAVGRLVWEKGYRELFDAAASLRDHRRLKLVVVGGLDPDKDDGVTERDLHEAAQRADIAFLGLRDDVAELYAAMDIYVLASHREGFPRSAMEAAAMGLPIVATNVRGCRQVVDDGVNGRLVTVRDPASLARAMLELTTDDETRTAMGKASIVKARREFDQRRQIDVTLGVYERLTRPAPSAGES